MEERNDDDDDLVCGIMSRKRFVMNFKYGLVLFSDENCRCYRSFKGKHEMCICVPDEIYGATLHP
jgi:hypothetical protein